MILLCLSHGKMRCRGSVNTEEGNRIRPDQYSGGTTVSSGTAGGFNNKAKLTFRRIYVFGTYRAMETALYHTLGDLPEPKFTYRFC